MRGLSLATGLLLLAASTCAVSASADARSAAAVRAAASGAKKKPPSDQQIKKILIDESIAAYAGNCPCPYSRAKNGSRCGKRSAWSRAGGEEPLCYPADVTAEMVQAYRDAHPEE